MSSHPQEPPDEGGEEEEAKRNKYKRTLSRQAVEARARAGALLGENYEQLRATCPKLPQTGYLSRAKILEGGVSEIRSLQGEIRYLHGRLMAAWKADGVQVPRLPGLIPLGSRGHHETRGWNGSQFLQPDLTAQSRDGSQLPRPQPGSLQIIDVRSEGELLQPDLPPTDQPESLQIINVRGGSELRQIDPSLVTQVRSENQLVQSPPDSVQVTRDRGGDEINVLVEGSAPLAHARGGWSQGEQGNDRPEVVVLWQGAAKQPVQPAPPSTRPFLVGKSAIGGEELDSHPG